MRPLRRPLVERTITMACVSNPVGGDLISTANFVGVDLRELRQAMIADPVQRRQYPAVSAPVR